MSSVEHIEKAIDEDEPMNLDEEKEDGYITLADRAGGDRRQLRRKQRESGGIADAGKQHNVF